MAVLSEAKLRHLLVEPGHIGEEDFRRALEDAKRTKKDLATVLVDGDFINDEQLGQLIAEDNNWHFVNLRKETIDDSIFKMIPENLARAQGVIAFGKGPEGFKVGLRNPDDLELKNLLEKKLGGALALYYITDYDLDNAVLRYRRGIEDEFGDILQLLKDRTRKQSEKDTLIVNTVDALLLYGYEHNASDIHIEPHTDKAVVRFRIDGVLHDVLEIPRGLLDFVVSRIKILSRLRIDEHQSSQDGKFRYQAGDDVFDVRVSILPVITGENIVLRLLSSKNRQYNLNDLGMSERDLNLIKKVIEYPHGMILVTGPTGSGKTTTLYSFLKVLNRREIHISTIEDPVEYNIDGVSQIQVNPKANLTFASGLRSIVRQDPDVIMVGEIRDEETADIAVNSALTGHLVLSTLHTNDAATALPRLLDMKVQPFLVASTVNVILGQRLIRQVCSSCRASYHITPEEIAIIKSNESLSAIFQKKGYKDLNKVLLYKGEGCKVCGNTGYAGRLGIFEILEVTEKVRSLITHEASSSEIVKQARADGMTTMLEDGLDKVFSGLLSLTEVISAVRE